MPTHDTDLQDAPTKRRHPLLRKLLKLVLALVTIAAVAVIVYDYTGKRRYEQALAAARATGEPVTLIEIENARTPIPDDQNGAPHFLELGDELETLSEQTNGADVPILGNADDPPLGHRWPSDVDEAAGALLTQSQPLIERIDALKRYADGRFPFDPTVPFGEQDFSWLRDLRTAAKLEVLQLAYAAQHNQTANLPSHVESIVHLSRFIDDEPTIIAGLVAVAMDGLCCSSIETVLAYATLTPADLDALDKTLAQIDRPDRLYWGMLGERGMMLETTDDYFGRMLSCAGIRGLMYRDEARCLEHYAMLIRWSKNVEESIGRNPNQLLEQEAAAKNTSIFAPISSIMLPSLTRALELDLRSLGAVRATRTALAVERFRFANNRWPDSLDDLVPDYLPALFLDPCDGAPIRYVQHDNNVIVYSIGEDRTDDGGNVAPWNTTDRPTDFGCILLHPDNRDQPPVATQPSANDR